jgi:glycine hydroxymethyltransferase
VRRRLAKAVDSAVFPGLQGGPLEHVIAAKAVAFAEAARPEFRTYAAQVVANAAALATALAAEGSAWSRVARTTTRSWSTCGTFDAELTGKEAQEVLDRAGITCNRNTIPDDPRSPFVTSGLRLGTAAQTTAGMGTDEMRPSPADLIGARSSPGPTSGRSPRCAPRSPTLCAAFPPYPDLSWPSACPTSAGTAWSSWWRPGPRPH